MKFFRNILLMMSVMMLFVACKPSDKYAGEWQALTGDGEEVTLHFDQAEKRLTITGDDGEEVHDINQNAAGFKNSLQYYRIDIESDAYYIIFADRKDEANAQFVKQTNHASDYDDMVGEIIFTMSRDEETME